jgi:hypothetical protein
MAALYAKLEVENRVELALMAFRLLIVPEGNRVRGRRKRSRAF